MKKTTISITAILLLSMSCVSKKKYVALEQENGQIKSELTKEKVKNDSDNEHSDNESSDEEEPKINAKDADKEAEKELGKLNAKKLSPEEEDIINKYKNGLTTQEFIKLTYNEKERFLDVYPRLNKPITDEIFNTLPYELKNKYIGMNIGLSDAQYNSIQSDKNLLKRYVQMVEKKFENFPLLLYNDSIDQDFFFL